MNHPSCVMTPVFSPWTFGPASLPEDSTMPNLLWTNQPIGRAKFLSIHFALTLGNFMVNILGDFTVAWSIRKDTQLYPKLIDQGQTIFTRYIPLLMISFISTVTVMLWSSFKPVCCQKLRLEIRNLDTRVASSESEKGDEINLRPLAQEVSPESRFAIAHSNFNTT